MTEIADLLLGTLKKLEPSSQLLVVDGKTILCIGTPPINATNLLRSISQYRRKGSDCFDATVSEIQTGRATGCFINTELPRHVMPARQIQGSYVAYDDPLEGVDNIAFFGNQRRVARAIENFYQITNHHYGKSFVFRDKP